MSKYADIIARLENATGPNFELECEVRRVCEQGADVLDKVPPAYTASIDAAVRLINHMLPGWGWRIATCCVSDDAFVFPDFNDQKHRDRLLATVPQLVAGEEWSDFTDIDQRPPGRPAIALLRSMFFALGALEDNS